MLAPTYDDGLIDMYPPRLELTDDEKRTGVKRRFGWAFKPEALVQYLETMTDESFKVPVQLRDKFDGKEKYAYKDLTKEHHLDEDCKAAYMLNLQRRVARYWSERYKVPVRPFDPVSRDYYIGVSVWDTKTERGFQMVHQQCLEPMMAELNNIFGSPNFESTEAMWWRALDDIEWEMSIRQTPV